MVTMKRLALLTLAGICISSTSFIRADYKRPIWVAPGTKTSNLVVNYYEDRPINYGSIVKVVDGCRVIYLSDAYLDKNLQLQYAGKSSGITVSDIECKKDLK